MSLLYEDKTNEFAGLPIAEANRLEMLGPNKKGNKFMNLSAFKCPNCGANLNLNYAGTVRCEYCGGYIEIAAMEPYEEILYADDKSVVDISAAIKDTSVSTSEAAMNIRKMLSCV